MKLAFVAILAVVLVSACGAPETTADVQSSLNGHSVPPPGGTLSDCSGPSPTFWKPLHDPWPAHGFCQWQPLQTSSPWPYNVSPCWGPAPAASGSMWVYSGLNFTGNCASVNGNAIWPGYQFDTDVVQANGWLSIWTPRFSNTPMMVNIKSIRVAPSTNLLLCEGPLTGPPGAPCNQYRMIGIGTFAQGVNYPSVFYPDGSPFTVAAIEIGTPN